MKQILLSRQYLLSLLVIIERPGSINWILSQALLQVYAGCHRSIIYILHLDSLGWRWYWRSQECFIALDDKYQAAYIGPLGPPPGNSFEGAAASLKDIIIVILLSLEIVKTISFEDKQISLGIDASRLSITTKCTGIFSLPISLPGSSS